MALEPADVDKLLDNDEVGDLMDSLYFYIMCYMGKPRQEALDRIRTLRVMRTTRKGRRRLTRMVQDLRTLGDAGLMSTSTFRKIARHLVSMDLKHGSTAKPSAEVDREMDGIRKQLGRSGPLGTVNRWWARKGSFERQTTPAAYARTSIRSGNSAL